MARQETSRRPATPPPPSRPPQAARRRPRIAWTPEERQLLIVRGAEIMRATPDANPTTVLKQAQDMLPRQRRRTINSVREVQYLWFTKGLLAELKKRPPAPPIRSEADRTPQPEPEPEPEPEPARDHATPERHPETTYLLPPDMPAILLNADPAQLLIGLLYQIIRRLEGFDGRLINLERALARVTHEASSTAPEQAVASVALPTRPTLAMSHSGSSRLKIACVGNWSGEDVTRIKARVAQVAELRFLDAHRAQQAHFVANDWVICRADAPKHIIAKAQKQLAGRPDRVLVLKDDAIAAKILSLASAHQDRRNPVATATART